MDTVQFVLLIAVAALTGMASVLDEAQFHRPLIACTLVGLVLGDVTTGVILGGTLELMALGWMNVGAAMADTGNTFGIEMCHVAGLLLQAIRVAVPAALVALIAGTDTVSAMLNSIPEVVTRGLQVAGGFIVVVGYAMVINMMNAKSLMPYFFLGFLLAVFTNFNLIGFGAVGLLCAFFHIKGLEREAQAAAACAGGGTGNPVDDVDDSDLM